MLNKTGSTKKQIYSRRKKLQMNKALNEGINKGMMNVETNKGTHKESMEELEIN